MDRTTPPYRADHVGSFLRPKRLLEARARHARGEIDAAALRAVEDAAIRDVVRRQEEVGLRGITDGEFRRTFFHVDFLEQLDGVEVGEGSFTATFRRDDGTEVGFRPPTMRVTGAGPPRPQHPGPRLRVPEERDRADAQGVHPVALDAAFPRRPPGDQRRGLSRPRGVLARPRRRLPRGDPGPRRARLPLPAARRHQPRVPVRRCDPRRDPGARRRSGRAAAPLLPPDQRGDPRPARRHGGLHPSLPRQLPERLGRAGRLRAGRRDPVQRARGRRLLPRVRRSALGRLRPAALRAQGQDRGARRS